MRTDDFSKAPAIGQAGVMLVGGTHVPHGGPTAWLRHIGRHRVMVAQLRRASGYRAHRTHYQPPFTLGIVAWFDTMEGLVRFARTGAHPELAAWAGTDDGATGDDRAWVRVYRAHGSGYTNGVWRAEENVMRNIETFTPVGREEVGPPVQRERRTGSDVEG